MTVRVAFVDTGVLLELLDVPGRAQEPVRYRREYLERQAAGQGFVLPTAAVIEAGNHISNATGPNVDARAVAARFDSLVRDAAGERGGWELAGTTWDRAFVDLVLDGGSTAVPFVDHAAAGRFGTGDLSILAERDAFVSRSGFVGAQVEVWTTEVELPAWA